MGGGSKPTAGHVFEFTLRGIRFVCAGAGAGGLLGGGTPGTPAMHEV